MKNCLLVGLLLISGFCFGQTSNLVGKNETTKEYRDKIIPVLSKIFYDNDENRSYDCYYAAPVLIFEDNLIKMPEFFTQGQDFSRKIYESSDKEYCIKTLLQIKRLCKSDLIKVFDQANVLTIAFVFNSIYKDDNNKIRNTQSTYSIEIDQLKEEHFEDKLVKW